MLVVLKIVQISQGNFLDKCLMFSSIMFFANLIHVYEALYLCYLYIIFQDSTLELNNLITDIEEFIYCCMCKTSSSDSDKFNKTLQLFCDSCYKRMKFNYFNEWFGHMYEIYNLCFICGNSFYNNHDLYKHDCLCVHLFSCNYCNVILDKKYDIARHVTNCTNKFPRLSCNVDFTSPSTSLSKKNFNVENKKTPKTHLRTRTNKNRFICYHCKKSFCRHSHLKRHLNIHTNKDRFKCEYCKKSYNRSDSLKRHLHIHTNDKPFCCKYCKKSFNDSSNLKTHLRIHTNVKPFNCEYCKKSFSHCSSLKKHVIIHTDDKPFQCKHCEKTFNRSWTLNRHLRIHDN